MASKNDVKEEVSDEHSEQTREQLSDHGAGGDATEAAAMEEDKMFGENASEDVEIADVDVDGEPGAHSDAAMDNGDDADGDEPGQIPEGRNEYDPTFDQTLMKPLFERREKSLKELLDSMDEFAPIIPDAVTDYYLARSGLKTNDQRIKRLLALATQKFVSDIASDAYQYSRIRSQAGGTASSSGRGRGGQGSGANSARTVLTMESLSGILGDYGINTKRPDFYR